MTTRVAAESISEPELNDRVYESLHTEHDYTVNEIEGRLPEGLTGTLFRIGPGKFEVGHGVGHLDDHGLHHLGVNVPPQPLIQSGAAAPERRTG